MRPMATELHTDGAPEGGSDTWLSLSAGPLPVDEISQWVKRPQCGAVVIFSGNARDHAEGRPGVTLLEYEAYETQVVPRLGRLAEEARRRWPEIGRMALVHRTGPVDIGEAAVVVAVSSPHRDAAFEAARWCIDTLKATVPIWKREIWDGGESWGVDAQQVMEVPQGTELDGGGPL